ncbi:DUF1887 family CARF protein [Clostridium aestuarii]|uniref:DUF1887 family CARF protein n=1 Tax=Clostridium aestuarii TaxID=338193 RepID=A0ABT4D2L2_9CLOT|nr:DUF1887 family CARF protein [Clostridium aestuarii]MCY6485469.1 DUF1887 family CARF protein [Clostridium aestuarii]
MNELKKADLLYLIMGTNPFPNLISVITRVKDNGKIICICTKETKQKPFRRLRSILNKLIGKELKVDLVEVKTDEIEKIEKSINESLISSTSELEKDATIELNYTGGTKVMSSVAYNTFKIFAKLNKQFELIVSYIDSEKEKMFYESNKNDGWKPNSIRLIDLKTKYKLNVLDIVSTYNNIKNINKNIKAEPYNQKLAEEISNLFIGVSKEQYDIGIKFLEEFFKGNFKKNDKIKGEKLKNEIDNILKKFQLLKNIKSCSDLVYDDNEIENALLRAFQGIWFEDFIFKILLELKEEGILDDVVGSLKKIKGDIEEENKFEVDLVAYRKYKLFAISVTSIDKEKDAKSKLYEIRQRSKELAGDETGICYINLCWKVDKLKEEYVNIWDSENPKNTLIIGVDGFKNLKERLKEWILRGTECE